MANVASTSLTKSKKGRTSIEYRSKQDASVVRERKTVVAERVLEVIYKEHGNITPQLLVDVAADEGSPIHNYFEWDDGVAGAKYRLVQATSMILASKFVCVLKEQHNAGELPKIDVAMPLRKFIPQLGRSSGFRMRNEVLTEEDGRAAFIERKLGALRAWCNSVVDVTELAGMRAAIESQLPPKVGQ